MILMGPRVVAIMSRWKEEEPRARPRYPGVEDLFRRATLLRETHPYPSMEGEEEEGLFKADAVDWGRAGYGKQER